MDMKQNWLKVLALTMTLALLLGASALAEDPQMLAGGSSKAAAASVSYDQLYAAEVTASGDHWYKFTPSTAGFTWIYVKNNSVDRYVDFYVYSAIEEKMWSKGYNSGGSGSGCVRLNAGSTYYVKISTKGTSGYYQFKLTFVADPDSDNSSGATPIALNTAYGRTIGGTDVDWFTFTTGNAGSYTLAITAGQKSGSLYYGIFTAVEEKLVSDSISSSSGGSDRETVTLNANTKYYMKIWSTSSFICDYTFTLVSTDKDSNTVGGATPIELNTEYARAIDGKDADWFVFTTAGAGSYTLYISAPAKPAGTLNYGIFTGTEEKLVGSSFYNTGSDRKTVVLEGGRQYYVKIWSTAEYTCDYTFSVINVDKDGNVIGGATPIALNTEYKRSMDGKDTDWFVFTTGKAGSYNLSLSVPSKPNGDFYYGIFDKDEKKLVGSSFYYTGSVLCTASLEANTKYYVKLWSTGEYTCDYTFTLISTDEDSNALKGATKIELNTEYKRTMDGKDTDWFVFTTAGAGDYTLNVSAPVKPNGTFNYGIFDVYEKKLAGGDFYYTGSASRKAALAGGTKYYVKIWSSSEYRCDYIFSVEHETTPITDAKVTLPQDDYVYTGLAIKPVPTVTMGDTTLKKGTDFTVKYANNKKVGTATVTVTGKGDYGGSVTLNFTISPAPITSVKLSKTSYVYTGTAHKPTVTVKSKVNGKTVTLKSTQYTVAYKNNKAVGKATVTVTGKGSYGGTITKTFKITPVSLKDVKVFNPSLPYTGKKHTPIIRVRAEVNGKTVTLKKTRDYTVTYKDNVEPGTATVTVKGKGNYTGTLTATFKINKLKMSMATITLSKTQMDYTGKALKPKVTVKYKVDGKTVTLVKDTDYTVTYKNNVEPGTASVIIKGKGHFTGSKTVTFTIQD